MFIAIIFASFDVVQTEMKTLKSLPFFGELIRRCLLCRASTTCHEQAPPLLAAFNRRWMHVCCPWRFRPVSNARAHRRNLAAFRRKGLSFKTSSRKVLNRVNSNLFMNKSNQAGRCCCHAWMQCWSKATADKYLRWPNGEDSTAHLHPLTDDRILRLFHYDTYVATGRIAPLLRERIVRLRKECHYAIHLDEDGQPVGGGVTDDDDDALRTAELNVSELQGSAVDIYQLSQLIRLELAQTRGGVIDRLAADLEDKGLHWSTLFKAIDTHHKRGKPARGDNKIHPSELHHYLDKYAKHNHLPKQSHVSKEAIHTLFQAADQDHNGYLSLDEFVTLMNTAHRSGSYEQTSGKNKKSKAAAIMGHADKDTTSVDLTHVTAEAHKTMAKDRPPHGCVVGMSARRSLVLKRSDRRKLLWSCCSRVFRGPARSNSFESDFLSAGRLFYLLACAFFASVECSTDMCCLGNAADQG